MNSKKLSQKFEPNHLLIFDDRCPFCRFWIGKIVKSDQKKILAFSPRSSNYAKKILQQVLGKKSWPDSIIWIEGIKKVRPSLFFRAKAIKKITKMLPNPPWALRIFSLMPIFLGDVVYLVLAHFRKKLFSKKEIRLDFAEGRFFS